MQYLRSLLHSLLGSGFRAVSTPRFGGELELPVHGERKVAGQKGSEE